MATTPSPARQIEAIFKEADPARRSQLVVERLLSWSKELGYHYWILGPDHPLNRGARLRANGEPWRWLPTGQPMSVAGCISGTLDRDGSHVWAHLREALGKVELAYVPLSTVEGRFVEALRARSLA